MSFFVKAQAATKPRADSAQKIALFYAGILVVFAVAQLFTFDTFIELILSFNLPFGETFSAALVPIVVASEVFALPFLLRMTLSPAFRWVSMMCGWLVALIWLVINGSVVNTYPVVETVGFLGTAINLAPGWWAVFVSLLLGSMAGWASWGMWPASRRKK